jgi:hypothetical protein
MGCDYYICKYLAISDKKGIDTIEIERENGYFFDFNLPDADAEDYEQKRISEKEKVLEVHFVPILIYENKKFVREVLETKYKSLVEDWLDDNKCNDRGIVNMDDIISIYKIEKRFER